MQSIQIKILLFSLFVFLMNTSCKTKEKKQSNEEVSKTETCEAHPKHTYEVFIPAINIPLAELPLFVAIDSHGSGKNAVKHLKKAATDYPSVLVVSNLIKNNNPHYMQELDELIADVRKKYPCGNRTYFTGFSGGSRMVLGYVTNHSANGVIACGAYANEKQIKAIKCPAFGLIGMDDFNFSETVNYILDPVNSPQNAHIELITASHEWPSPERLSSAFGWLRLSDQSDKNISKEQRKNYVMKQKARIDSLEENDDLIQAVCISKNMSDAKVFDDLGAFKAETKHLAKEPAFNKQLNELTQSLKFEFAVRQAYGKVLMTKDEKWWQNEIAELQKKTDTEPNKMKKMAYKRIKGFLGIVCFSYSRNFAQQRDIKHLEQILKVYKAVEPENEDMKHFSEVLETLKKQK